MTWFKSISFIVPGRFYLHKWIKILKFFTWISCAEIFSISDDPSIASPLIFLYLLLILLYCVSFSYYFSPSLETFILFSYLSTAVFPLSIVEPVLSFFALRARSWLYTSSRDHFWTICYVGVFLFIFTSLPQLAILGMFFSFLARWGGDEIITFGDVFLYSFCDFLLEFVGGILLKLMYYFYQFKLLSPLTKWYLLLISVSLQEQIAEKWTKKTLATDQNSLEQNHIKQNNRIKTFND